VTDKPRCSIQPIIDAVAEIIRWPVFWIIVAVTICTVVAS